MGHRIRLHYPNATSGSFEVHPHGENGLAEAFSDYDCLAPLDSADYALDANGIATFYVKVLVDVVVMASSGATVDTFTDGVRSESVTLESQSFTGTLPSGSQGATGVVDAATVWDRWRDSAGAPDWKVRRTGASADETIVTALAAVQNANLPFFDVTKYGALADGASDDYTAIKAAHDAAVAAGGGIVWFPAKTNAYLMSGTLAVTSQRVSFMGAGGKMSRIKYTGAITTYAFSIACGVTTEVHNFIAWLGFEQSVANSGAISVASAPGFAIVGVHVIMALGSHTNGDIYASTAVTIRDCCMSSDGAGRPWILLDTGADTSSVVGCRGDVNSDGAGTGNSWIEVRANDCLIDGNRLENGQNGSAGKQIYIPAATGGSRTVITNNRLIQFNGPAFRTAGIELGIDVPFFEANNTLNRTRSAVNVLFYTSLTTAIVSESIRGSRRGCISTSPGANYTPDLGYEFHYLTVTANVAINAPTLATEWPGHGGRLVFIVFNNSGGAINVTWNAAFNVTASPTAVNAAQRARIEFFTDGTMALSGGGPWFRALAAAGNF